jgi:hypothetical protein
VEKLIANFRKPEVLHFVNAMKCSHEPLVALKNYLRHDQLEVAKHHYCRPEMDMLSPPHPNQFHCYQTDKNNYFAMTGLIKILLFCNYILYFLFK